jgi:putative membrane protein
MNALTFLSERKPIEEAIARLEQRSAAEVVCVVATESGRYDRAESLIGLVLGLVGLGLAESVWRALEGSWGTPTPLFAQAAGVIAGFIAGLLLGSYVHPLRRALVSKAEMEEEVRRGAAAAFTASRVGATADRVGVLVYVSLFEHRVVVQLDSGVQAHVPADFAAQLVDRAVSGLKSGTGAAALAELVDLLATTLADKLPVKPGDTNELPNHVIALHPR